MTDEPTSSAKEPRATRPTVKNADVPSDTVGLPGVGEGASAAHFPSDTVRGQQADTSDRPESHAPGASGDGAGSALGGQRLRSPGSTSDRGSSV